MTALSPITHNGDTFGNIAEFNSMTIIQSDGTAESIPAITGNSIRGQFRDELARHLCDTLQITLEGDVFHLLFGGGGLSKKTSVLNPGTTYDPEYDSYIRRLLPSLSLLGGSSGNFIMPGRFNVGMIIPILHETRHIVPEQYHDAEYLPSVADVLQETEYTRSDDSKNGNLSNYLSDRDDRVQQMRYTVQTLAAGTQFYWHAALSFGGALEHDAFLAAYALWAQRAILGGMGRIGHGLVRVEMHDRPDLEIDPLDGIAPPVPASYTEHMLAHRDEIIEVLHGIPFSDR
jgi:hypothetical protein